MANDEELAEDNGEGIKDDDEAIEEACRRFVYHKQLLASTTKKIKEDEAALKSRMGTNRFLEAGKYTVTWQTQPRKEYTVPAGTTRRFSIKERADG